MRMILDGVFSQFVSLWFGNTAGLKANYGALKELKKIRKEFLSYNDDKLVKNCNRVSCLKNDGFVMIKKAIDPDNLSKVQANLQKSFSKNGLHAISPNRATLFVPNPEKEKSVQNLLTPEIKEIIEGYYKCAFRINSVRIWRNNHVPGADNNKHDVFSNTFHHDNYKVTGLRVFILLVDGVNKETGALRFHDKKSSIKIVRNFGYFHRFMLSKSMLKRLTDPKSLKYFEGNAGDCTIINTQECLHAASIPKYNSFRDILQFEVYPDFGPLKKNDLIFAEVPPDHEVNNLIDSKTG